MIMKLTQDEVRSMLYMISTYPPLGLTDGNSILALSLQPLLKLQDIKVLIGKIQNPSVVKFLTMVAENYPDETKVE